MSEQKLKERGTSGCSVTQRLPVRYEIVDKNGRTWGPYLTAEGAAEIARSMYPDQPQDEDRKGFGWDMQAVRS